MKTIEKGGVEDTPSWWVGKTVKCNICNFEGMLEDSDREKISTTAERRPDGERTVAIQCPNCLEMSARYREKGGKAK